MQEVYELLFQAGAVDKGHHYVYKSGKHGDAYINMDYLFPDIPTMERICRELGAPFEHQFSTVIGAATGGIPLAFLTASLAHVSQALWADKSGDEFAFSRAGYGGRLAGRKVLVVEDLLNTGDTTKKIIAQARKWGADIVGVSVVCNRGDQTAKSLDVPRMVELSSVDMEVFDPISCRLCDASVPIVSDVGHGDKHQAKHPAYTGGYVRLLS